MIDQTVLFIGGLTRSGTTAVSDIVNECPDVAVMAEYRLLDLIENIKPILDYERTIEELEKTYDPAYRGSSSSNTIRSQCNNQIPPEASLTNYPGFVNSLLTQTLRYPTTSRFPLIVANVVKTSLNKPHAKIIGSKRPGTMLADSSPQLASIFPDRRYVAMLRSPLGQINSSVNRRNRALNGDDFWQVRTVEDAIAYYREVISGLITLKYLMGDAVLFIKYEEMISDQAGVFNKLFSHIGSTWRPQTPLVATERGTINVLSAEEHDQVENAFGALINAWDVAQLTGSDPVDLAIFHDLLPAIPESHCGIGGAQKPSFLIHGWSTAENEGVWTDAERAIMLFGSTLRPPSMLKIEFSPYLVSGKPLGLEIIFNGQPVGKTLLCYGAGAVVPHDAGLTLIPDLARNSTLWIGPLDFRSDNANILEFRFTGAHSPLSIGESSDSRILGIRLSGLEFLVLD